MKISFSDVWARSSDIIIITKANYCNVIKMVLGGLGGLTYKQTGVFIIYLSVSYSSMDTLNVKCLNGMKLLKQTNKEKILATTSLVTPYFNKIVYLLDFYFYKIKLTINYYLS